MNLCRLFKEKAGNDISIMSYKNEALKACKEASDIVEFVMPSIIMLSQVKDGKLIISRDAIINGSMIFDSLKSTARASEVLQFVENSELFELV